MENNVPQVLAISQRMSPNNSVVRSCVDQRRPGARRLRVRGEAARLSRRRSHSHPFPTAGRTRGDDSYRKRGPERCHVAYRQRAQLLGGEEKILPLSRSVSLLRLCPAATFHPLKTFRRLSPKRRLLALSSSPHQGGMCA